MNVSDIEIIDLLRLNAGLTAQVAEQLGVSHSWLLQRIKSRPKLTKALADCEERNLDLAEAKLLCAVERGEAWAIKLYLTTKGRGRGYNESKKEENKPREIPSLQVTFASEKQKKIMSGKVELLDDSGEVIG